MKSENIKLRQSFISTTFEYTSNLQFSQKSLARKENLCRQTCFFSNIKSISDATISQFFTTNKTHRSVFWDLSISASPSDITSSIFLAVRQFDSRLVRNNGKSSFLQFPFRSWDLFRVWYHPAQSWFGSHAKMILRIRPIICPL